MRRPGALLLLAIVAAAGLVARPARTERFDERAAVPGQAVHPPSAPPAAGTSPAAPAQIPPVTETRLGRGETLENALRRQGLERPDAAAVVAALRGLDMRRLREGERVVVARAADGAPTGITYWRSPVERYDIAKDGEGWTARRVPVPVEVRIAAVRGSVRDSLFASMERLGESPALTAQFVSLFEWDFDFAADSLPGDRFRFFVEKRYAGGRFVGNGEILVAQYATAGRPVMTGVAYPDTDGRSAYYDARGRSVKKMFLRAPLDFTRITSGFSHARHHPILGGLTPHLAVDYGAPVGTPVRAVADGLVDAAGSAGGFGQSVTIRHARGYLTMYNHLSRIEVRRGQAVRQRQVIGRVGSTGLSTGPHLDYRVNKNGRWVNPLNEKYIPGSPIPPHRREAFQSHVEALLERLDREAPLPQTQGDRG